MCLHQWLMSSSYGKALKNQLYPAPPRDPKNATDQKLAVAFVAREGIE